MFIEVTDRRDATFKMVLNQDLIIKVTDDGTGAQIVYRNTASQQGKGVETHLVAETYAAVKTALGL